MKLIIDETSIESLGHSLNESIFPITVKKLTDKEMIWAFEENANMDYSDGDFHYNTNDKHLIRQKWFFTKLQ